MPTEHAKEEGAKKAGCFALCFAWIGGMFASCGRCLGHSWFAINPTGRIVTQLLFLTGLASSAVACIPALQDLYWGWILMLFACVAGVSGLFYGFEEKVCGPKMPNLDKMKIGKDASKCGLIVAKPTYFLSIVCWLGVIGMSAYILYLYIFPISRGFTSAEAFNSVPPLYCDKVTGQSSRWTVPTPDAAYCDQIIAEWNRGAAATGIGIGILLGCVLLGSCLHTGNKTVLVMMAAKKMKLDTEFNAKMITVMEEQAALQAHQIELQRVEILKLEGQAPGQPPAPAGVDIAPVPVAYAESAGYPAQATAPLPPQAVPYAAPAIIAAASQATPATMAPAPLAPVLVDAAAVPVAYSAPVSAPAAQEAPVSFSPPYSSPAPTTAPAPLPVVAAAPAPAIELVSAPASEAAAPLPGTFPTATPMPSSGLSQALEAVPVAAPAIIEPTNLYIAPPTSVSGDTAAMWADSVDPQIEDKI